jgi:hypothetical protein
MPGDGLALAIRVGGQQHAGDVLGGAGDLVHAGLAAVGQLPVHGEILVGPDRPVLGRQVADMAEAGQHRIVAAEIFIDRLGLRGRLDDDEGLVCQSATLNLYDGVAGGAAPGKPRLAAGRCVKAD